MKVIEKLSLFILCGFALLLFSETSLAQQKSKGSDLEKAVDKYLAAEAAKNEADEYPEARRIVEGDIDGDGDNDAALLYTLEGLGGGGNNWVQIVAVFINTDGVYKNVADLTVGGKLFRSFEIVSVGKGTVTGSSETCTDAPQGLCDNPKKEIVTLIFAKSELKEQQKKGRK